MTQVAAQSASTVDGPSQSKRGLEAGIPSAGPERYVTRGQLAAMMCVSVRTIDSMVHDGMPSETWGRRTRRFLPSIAIAWAQGQGSGA